MSAVTAGYRAVRAGSASPDGARAPEGLISELVVRLLAQSPSGRLSFRQIADALTSMQMPMTPESLSRLVQGDDDPRTTISPGYVDRVPGGLAITPSGWRHIERR